MRNEIEVTRRYNNGAMQARSLDTNYLNTMTVVASQRATKLFPKDRGWVAFEKNGRRVFRYVAFSRQFHATEDRICIDYAFARALRVTDGDKFAFKAVERLDFLCLPS